MAVNIFLPPYQPTIQTWIIQVSWVFSMIFLFHCIHPVFSQILHIGSASALHSGPFTWSFSHNIKVELSPCCNYVCILKCRVYTNKLFLRVYFSRGWWLYGQQHLISIMCLALRILNRKILRGKPLSMNNLHIKSKRFSHVTLVLRNGYYKLYTSPLS